MHKKKKEIIIETSTHEVLISISCYRRGCELLLENRETDYKGFLNKLLENNFYENDRSIKKIAQETGYKKEKIPVWIRNIYNDIFELNNEKPELFRKDGFKVILHISHYDTRVSFTLWVNIIPRAHEQFSWYFLKGKFGIDYFWVEKIHHDFDDNEMSTRIWLKGGFLNRYRELLKDRATYEGVIGGMELFHLNDFEIDDRLRSHYRRI